MDAKTEQQIADRLAAACEQAGDAAPAVKREQARRNLGRAARSGLLTVLQQTSV